MEMRHFFSVILGLCLVSGPLRAGVAAVNPHGLPMMPLATFTPPAPPVAASKSQLLRGRIKLDGDDNAKTPQFRVLFAGKETMSNNEGFFSVPLDENLRKFSLLLCRSVKQHFEKTNTVKEVGVVPESDYYYVEFEKLGYGDLWRQQVLRLDAEKPVISEESSVIVLVDPSYVNRLEPWKIEVPSGTVKLPMIVLRQDIDLKTLGMESARSLLGSSMEAKLFHEPIKEEVRQVAQNNNAKGSIVVSVVN